jgi:hypothetical protein
MFTTVIKIMMIIKIIIQHLINSSVSLALSMQTSVVSRTRLEKGNI